MLTPATAIRYEKNDRKVRQMTREEELSVGKNKRKVDIREEYYVSDGHAASWPVSTSFMPTVCAPNTEDPLKRHGELGTEASQAIARRERRHFVAPSP